MFVAARWRKNKRCGPRDVQVLDSTCGGQKEGSARCANVLVPPPTSREGPPLKVGELCPSKANLRTKILDVRGFDSSRTLISRGGIPRPMGDFLGKSEPANLVLGLLSMETGHTDRSGPEAAAGFAPI